MKKLRFPILLFVVYFIVSNIRENIVGEFNVPHLIVLIAMFYGIRGSFRWAKHQFIK